MKICRCGKPSRVGRCIRCASLDGWQKPDRKPYAIRIKPAPPLASLGWPSWQAVEAAKQLRISSDASGQRCVKQDAASSQLPARPESSW